MLAQWRVDPLEGQTEVGPGAGRTKRAAEEKLVAIVDRQDVVVPERVRDRYRQPQLLSVGEHLVVRRADERDGLGPQADRHRQACRGQKDETLRC